LGITNSSAALIAYNLPSLLRCNGRIFGNQSLLLPGFAVIPAVVAGIAPVGSDLDTGSMALVTYRTIVLHMPGLLLLIHGD
jgi:hypothetical protein